MNPEVKTADAGEIIICCQSCGGAISQLEPYTCISRNVEQLSGTGNDQRVHVLRSEILLALCGSCANSIHAGNMLRLLQVVTRQHRAENN